jgi:FKBP-type peptidyl-prolyl cis-trans isomerase SlyD
MSNSATVADDQVVSFHYTLTDPEGEVLDSSADKEPLQYLHGHDNIIPGLESALTGKAVGEKVSVDVAAKDGYGERDPERVIELPRDNFEFEVEPGTLVRAESPDGSAVILKVVSADEENVTLDGNHPLAGVDLHFDVEVSDIRDASAEELAHGHVHEPGGATH